MTIPSATDGIHEAIQAFWRANPTLQALTSDGNLWEIEAPEGTLFPYAEFFHISEIGEIYTTREYFSRARFQFNFHAGTIDRARVMERAFIAAFTQADLPLSPASVLHVLFESEGDDKGIGKGPDGQDSYVAFVEFDMLIHNPYGY